MRQLGKEKTQDDQSQPNTELDRRGLLKLTGASVAVGCLQRQGQGQEANTRLEYRFDGPDSLVLGGEWQSLNPGYWQRKSNAIRRRLVNVGDRARKTGFPFHYANVQKQINIDYDPSLPAGIVYRRDWKMAHSFSLVGEFVFRSERPSVGDGDDPNWQMNQDGYGFAGLALGAKSLFESFGKIRHAIQIGYSDDGSFQILMPPQRRKKTRAAKAKIEVPRLRKGDTFSIAVEVKRVASSASELIAVLTVNSEQYTLNLTLPNEAFDGYVGIAGRGLIDFQVDSLAVDGSVEDHLDAPNVECYACYPLGDSLKLDDQGWQVKFVSLFDTDGTVAQVRISADEMPSGGWEQVPVAGEADIINHSWRRNTAVIHATLPANPADQTLYYTIWKDGKNVTTDPRIGTDASGPGTGLVGDVPEVGSYVGRLPRLIAPYKVCGLSCHAITSGLQQRTPEGLKILGGGAEWQFRDQPSMESYKHLDDYNFQVMLWEDDVWYMELVMYPPSTDDAYEVIKNSICGPTSRWQLMRHWNVINPGDHDYGMDDVKGPEQLAIRRLDGLGQDASYMRRNFQIVHHLVTGAEEVDPLANPKKWRAWKMPNRDFTLVVLDSRLWRSSQDTDIWDDEGWGETKNIYDRTDPTRSLLGEEQFSWFQTLITTDSSPLICVTGINGMHTVWAGANYKGGSGPHLKGPFDQRDRVTADYAGWVKAGADRILELLGSRDGIVSVYGDVHNGCIMKNLSEGVIECSFGPIGRSGGRSVIPGFGRQMKDFDGRDLEVLALYHQKHADPDLNRHPDQAPYYWNFLELEFVPNVEAGELGEVSARIRNLIDAPTETPRGGGELRANAATIGRAVSSKLPDFETIPNADVQLTTTEGKPLRATRSSPAGRVNIPGLVAIGVGEEVLATAYDGKQVESKILVTV